MVLGGARNTERGSVIIMLFIAVALFGLLAFAMLQGSRSNLAMMSSEAQKAEATRAQDCANVIDMAAKRLEARGCGALVSYNQDGSNGNAGAPADGSCSIYHSNGGGVKPCGPAAAPPACASGGASVGGHCWYHGGVGASCTTTCGNVGLSYDPATESYAGSAGTNAQCQAIMGAFGAIGDPAYSEGGCWENIGCYWDPSWPSPDRIARCTNMPATASGSYAPARRACACQ